MLPLLLLMLGDSHFHRSTITADVTADSDDACVSGCACTPTAIVCKRDDLLTSFPLLRSAAAAANITDV